MDAGTPQPEHSSAQGDIPADWPLGDFPDPNPYFPPPPRPVRWGGYWGALLVVGLAVASAWIGFTLLDADAIAERFGLLGLVSALFVVAILLANTRSKAAPWRRGRVLPARVYIAPKGPPASLVWHLLGLIPLMGIVMSIVSGWIAGSRNYVHVIWAPNGEPEADCFEADRFWKRYRDSLDVWVCITPKGKLLPLEQVAPRAFQRVPVPDEVELYLDANTPEPLRPIVAHRKLEFMQREMHEAAKTSTKQFKRASRYEKRPG